MRGVVACQSHPAWHVGDAAAMLTNWSRGQSGSVVSGDRVVHVEYAWTTAIIVEIARTGGRISGALTAIADCAQLFAQVDKVFSPFRPDSLTTLYRRGLVRPNELTTDFCAVLAGCRRARAASANAFDPWSMPAGFDPLGYVKGWAAGQASSILCDAGFPHHMVAAGGDVMARGDQLDLGVGWRVGVLNPHDRARVLRVARLHDCAMATSGNYERGEHVLNPFTGRTATGTDSATVVGPDPGMADALASAALVSGPEAIHWFARLGPSWSLLLVVGQEVLTWGAAFPAAD